MREKIIRDELGEIGIVVRDIVEDLRGLRVSVEFEGSEGELRDRLPDHYDVDSVVESTEGTTAMIRHRL